MAQEPDKPENADEKTVEVTPPEPLPAALEAADSKTREVTPPKPVPVSPEEADSRLAAALARRGVPSDEINRLMSIGKPEAQAVEADNAPVELPPSKPVNIHPTISLPEARETSAEEQTKADTLVRNALLAYRRSKFEEAAALCRQAIDLAPSDAQALELYGDILQAIGRVDDALFAYQRADEVNPKLRSAEKKYAELLLLQNREIELLRDEYNPRNPYFAVILSCLFPGAGQIYNGESVKGLVVAVAMLTCVIILGWTPLGFMGQRGERTLNVSLMIFIALAAIIYLYALIDALIGASKSGKPKSGWEV